MTLDSQYLSALRELLTTRLDDGELRNLCFDLGIDYDNLEGYTKADKARALIQYHVNRNQLNTLLSRLKQIRPDVPWPSAEQTQPIPEPSEACITPRAISGDQPSTTLLWKPKGAFIVAIIIMVAILGITLKSTQFFTILPSSSKEMVVDARKSWQSADISLKHESKIKIQCLSGAWTIDSTGTPYVDGDGYNQQADWAIVKTANIGSLIGKLADGSPFSVGCNSNFVATSDGGLFLTINDGYLEDNDGVILIKVTLY